MSGAATLALMPEFFESIPDHLIPWLIDQPVFWVASAPLSKEGLNLSPKGLKGSFRVNNPNEVWYEDLMGSGASSGQTVQTISAQTSIMRLQASKPFLMFVKVEE